jgi:hypothetical protein
MRMRLNKLILSNYYDYLIIEIACILHVAENIKMLLNYHLSIKPE